MLRSIRAASIFVLVAAAAFAANRPLQAAPLNLAAGALEIAESGSWQSNPGVAGDNSNFGGQKITDGGNSSPASLGTNTITNPGYVPVYEFRNDSVPLTTNYWLAPDNSTGYVTIDLGSKVQLGEIDLYNTHNDNLCCGDRATENFHLAASNSVDVNGNLISPTTILTGTLPVGVADPNNPGAINPDILSVSGSYRYISFVADSWQTNGAGLNEIRVYAVPTPEPGSLVLMGLGVIGLTVLWRRKK